MSTYTDLHNRAKETLNVDYQTRVTPQKAHFLNPENSFHGEFIGEAHLKGHNQLDGGKITNVLLEDAVLNRVKFKNGLEIDSILQSIDNICVELDRQNVVDNELCSNCKYLSTAIDFEIENRQVADELLSISLQKKIDYEADQSRLRDTALDDRIDVEISNRISADLEIQKSIIDRTRYACHFELVNHDNRVFPIKLQDFAVNSYIDSNPDAYVYINGNTSNAPIGKIENTAFDENGNIKSFTFNAFADHPNTYEITANGRFIYNFDNENAKTVYTGVGGYRLNCDLLAGKKLDEAQFILDSSNNNGYYLAYFDDTRTPAAKINGDYKYDSENHISNCLFTVTSNTLSNFLRVVPYTFDKNGRTLYFTGTDGSDCEITLCDNVFYMYENRKVGYYLPVKDRIIEEQFAKIFDDGFKFEPNGTLSAVHVHVKNHLGYFDLRRSNNFKSQFDDAHPYTFIQYNEDSNVLSVIDELVHYKYHLNNAHGTVIPAINDSVNKKIDDVYTTLGVTLTLPESEFAKYVNTSYVLNRDEFSNLYICKKQIETDNFGSIELIFNKDEYCLRVIIKQNGYPDAHMFKLFISDITAPEKIDGSVIKYESKRICEDIRNIKASELVKDDYARNKYIVKPDLDRSKLKFSGEKKVLIGYSKTEKRNVIDVLMPDKKEQISYEFEKASAKFILNFKITTTSVSQTDKFVKLNILSKYPDDRFYYTGRSVKDIYILKNKFTTLQFQEIRPHRYIITDLDYSEIDWRLKWLHNELSCHEISSTAHIMKLSDDVEFLLSVDRETMNYKGTLPQMAPTSPLDGVVRLSSFIAQSPHIYGGILKLGDMFKLSAPQYGVSAIYDKNDISTFLGENDYFIVNSPLLSVQDVEWKNLDIFRNSESEYAFLSIELTNQINSTSSYIVDEVKRISAELSTELCCCELSVAGLSTRVNELCSEISSTLILSVDELQRQIISNDTEIAEISDKVDFLLSVDKETVNYKGIIPAYTPEQPDYPQHWQLAEYISACIPSEIGVGFLDLKKGDLFKIGTAPAQKLFDKRNDPGHTVVFGSLDFFIVNKDVIHIADVLVEDLDIFRNPETEIAQLSTELSTELCCCELSVAGLSARVNELCTELSIAHNTLSTALSNEIERLSTSLSNTIKLSVEQLCSEIMSNDVDIAEISGKVDFLLSVGIDSMEYKGTVPEYKPAGSLTSDYHLSAFLKPIVDTPNGFIKNGFMYRLSAVQDTLSDHIGNSVKLGINDYLIVNTDTYLSSVTFDKLDIIRDASVECKQLSVELSTELCCCELSVNGISVEVNRLSTELSTAISSLSIELSTELCACELSVNGISVEVNRLSTELSTAISSLSIELSTELCACELSVNGISAKVNTLCSEISNTISISVDLLQKQIISNDSDISSISTDLSVLEHHYYDKTMSCDIVLEHVKGPKVTDHISAYVDKLLIVDEVTFDLYALTIRNGALNINKVKTIEENYHVDCCKK